MPDGSYINPVIRAVNTQHARNEFDCKLIELGYEPVAVAGKRALGDAWSTRPNTIEAIAAERAALLSAMSTGLRTGRLVGVDIDVIEPGHVAALKQLADEVLGWTMLERVGSKGAMLCYRNASPLSKITIAGTDPTGQRRKVEILGTGQQFVAYGIHPDTGRPYFWTNSDFGPGEPLKAPFAELPEVTPDTLRAFACRAAALFTELGYTNAAVSDPGTHAAAREAKRRGERVPVSIEDLREVLGFISPDCPRERWIACLGGIQATNLRGVPAEGMDTELAGIAQAWSRGDFTDGTPANWLGDDDVEAAFFSLDPEKPGGATYGTLDHAARQNGYTKPPPEPTDEEAFGDPAQYAEYVGASVPAAAWCNRDDEVALVSGADVEPEKIRWLWKGHYALGKIHVLAGKPEAGKNLITLRNAAIISTGGLWPDGTRAPLGDVVIWSGEDSFADTTLPRFMAMGGDRKRLFCVRDVTGANGEKRPFDPSRDVGRLCRKLRAMPSVRYLIIDPIAVVVASGRGASNNNAETRRALQPLADLAEERGIVIEGITHFAKNSEKRDVLERVIESTAFTAVARIVHVAHRSEDEDKPRRWVRIKGNIVKRGADTIVGYEYRAEETAVAGYPDLAAPALIWGAPLQGNARELIAEEREPGAINEAVMFLENMLRGNGGTMMVSDLKPAAEAHGHAWRTIENARTRMREQGRIAVKQNLGASHGGWRYDLIDPDKEPYPAPKTPW